MGAGSVKGGKTNAPVTAPKPILKSTYAATKPSNSQSFLICRSFAIFATSILAVLLAFGWRVQQDKSVYSHIQKLVDCLSNEDAAEPQYLPAKAAPSLITATPILLNRVDFNDKVCMGSDPKTQGTLVVVNDALVTGDAAHGWCSLIGYESVAAINSNNFFDARRVLDSCNVDRVYILGKQFNTGNCRTIAQDGTLGVVPCTEALPVLCMNKSPIVKPIFQSSLISHKFVVNHRALCHSDRPKSPFSVIVSGVAKITSLSSTSKEISTATFKGIESLSVTLEECESGAPTSHFILGANQISSNSIASGFAVKHDNLRIQPKPKSAPYADVIFSPTAKYKIEQLVLEDMNNKQQPSLQVGINMTVSTLEKCRYSVTSSSELSQVASKWSKRESNKFPFLELQSEYDLYHMQNPDCFQTTGSILVQFFDPDFPIFHISFDSKTNNNHVVIQQRFASAQGPHKIGADVDDGVGATDSSSSGSVDSRHLTLAGGGSFSMRAPFANNNNNSPKSEWSYDDLLKLELIPNI